MDYQRLYTLLFNSITDAIEALQAQNFGAAQEILVKAQQQAEDIYLEETDCEELEYET